MGALTIGAILRAEHETLKTACDEWIGQGDHKEDVMYLFGVCDLAQNLIDALERGEAGAKNGED